MALLELVVGLHPFLSHFHLSLALIQVSQFLFDRSLTQTGIWSLTVLTLKVLSAAVFVQQAFLVQCLHMNHRESHLAHLCPCLVLNLL